MAPDVLKGGTGILLTGEGRNVPLDDFVNVHGNAAKYFRTVKPQPPSFIAREKEHLRMIEQCCDIRNRRITRQKANAGVADWAIQP